MEAGHFPTRSDTGGTPVGPGFAYYIGKKLESWRLAMKMPSADLVQLKRLAQSLSDSRNQTSGLPGSGFDSLIRAALKEPGSGLMSQVAELMILNSASRLGTISSPSQSQPQFS